MKKEEKNGKEKKHIFPHKTNYIRKFDYSNPFEIYFAFPF